MGDDSEITRLRAQVAALEERLARARNAEERFDAFMEHSPVTAFIKDEAGRLLYINHAFREAFGFADIDWEGRTDAELWPQRTARALRANDERILASGKAESVEETVEREEGVEHWWTIKFPFRDASGKLHLAGMGTNLTERKRLESVVAQATKLDALGVMAGGIAHDFNNLLTAMLASCDMLRDAVSGPDTAEQLDDLQAAIDRAAWLTRQLLRFARRQTTSPEIVPVNDVVEDQITMARRLMPEDITIRWLPDPRVRTILIDVGAMEQVVMNVLLNARDAIAGTGVIDVRTRALEASRGEPRRAMLRVHDDGSGIAPDILPRVFEPFFTTKPMGSGTGLGLASCHGIVKQHGGQIRIESEKGRGTTVSITFPEKLGRERVSSPLPAPTGPGSECVALVEDEAAVRKGIAGALRAAGYRVLEAADGEDGLALLGGRLDEVDLLVTDVIMPRLSGPAMVDRLRQSRPHLRVLYLSGYSGQELTARGLTESDVDFIQKPVTPGQLLSRVRAALDQDPA